MRNPLKRLRTLLDCASTFSGPLDIVKYVYLKLSPVPFPKSLRIKLKGSDTPLLCRPNTSDLGTLLSTFKEGYHRPPHGLPANPVIFDLGANVGYTVVDLATRYPDARIIAVEMDPENYDLASTNIRPLGPRCTLLNAAVWTEDGEVSYEGNAADAFHISPPTGQSTHKVKSRSLASISAELDIDRIDYLKMDIEGAEREVIETAHEWADKVRMMNIEIHAPDIMDAVTAKLTELGFRCHPSPSHWASVIAVRDGG